MRMCERSEQIFYYNFVSTYDYNFHNFLPFHLLWDDWWNEVEDVAGNIIKGSCR